MPRQFVLDILQDLREQAQRLENPPPLPGPFATTLFDHMQPGSAMLRELREPTAIAADTKAEAVTGKGKRKREEDPDWEPVDDEEVDELEYFDPPRIADEKLEEDVEVAALRKLHTQSIVPKHEISPVDLSEFPDVKLRTTPYPHQLKATATIMQALDTPFKGLILADPPGMGKTLSMMLAIRLQRQLGRGPSVIIAPSSCVHQWKMEVETYFEPGEVSVFILDDKKFNPLDLFKYEVVICSYAYLRSEYLTKKKFLSSIDKYAREEIHVPPRRPYLCMLADIWKFPGTLEFGPFLCLDEAHAIKDMSRATYAAVESIRKRFEACIMMTSTPLDNTWLDVTALLSLLSGHKYNNESHMKQMFLPGSATNETNDRHLYRTPLASKDCTNRLTQLLDAVSMRRPTDFLATRLPPKRVEVVQFKLSVQDQQKSDEMFSTYKKHAGMNNQVGEDRDRYWDAMVQAIQHAYHPKLVDIMEFERELRKRNESCDEAEDNLKLTPEQRKELARWRQELRKDNNWKSNRVDLIVAIIYRTRERSPDDAIVVMDESLFFLDVVQAALEKMELPVRFWRYDGTKSPAQRCADLEAFVSSSGTRVLLATRGTCGPGLNIQAANVLIRCGVFWKVSWEEQADGRIYRPGQTKPVTIWAIVSDAKVEQERLRKKEAKDKANRAIVNGFTRKDDDKLTPRSIQSFELV